MCTEWMDGGIKTPSLCVLEGWRLCQQNPSPMKVNQKSKELGGERKRGQKKKRTVSKGEEKTHICLWSILLIWDSSVLQSYGRYWVSEYKTIPPLRNIRLKCLQVSGSNILINQSIHNLVLRVFLLGATSLLTMSHHHWTPGSPRQNSYLSTTYAYVSKGSQKLWVLILGLQITF